MMRKGLTTYRFFLLSLISCLTIINSWAEELPDTVSANTTSTSEVTHLSSIKSTEKLRQFDIADEKLFHTPAASPLESN